MYIETYVKTSRAVPGHLMTRCNSKQNGADCKHCEKGASNHCMYLRFEEYCDNVTAQKELSDRR